jgi:ArsR family transcriptional regulator
VKSAKFGVKTVKELLRIFKALSDETRLRIIKILEKGELCVCDITAALDMVQPKVSFHLNALKEAGLIIDRKAGRWTHYRLNDSDMLGRMLIVTVCERIPEMVMAGDRKKLSRFQHEKEVKKRGTSAARKDPLLRVIERSGRRS